jgi:hypothetical protein
MAVRQDSKTDKVDNDSGIRFGRPGSHLLRVKPHFPALERAVFSTAGGQVDVDASVERLSCGESLVARPVLDGNSEEKRQAPISKPQIRRHVSGCCTFTCSDVEYSGSKFSTAERVTFGQRSDFESVQALTAS